MLPSKKLDWACLREEYLLELRCLITREIFSGEVTIDVYKIMIHRRMRKQTPFDERGGNGTIKIR